MKKAWQIERELRVAAVPVDRRVNQSHYNDEEAAFNTIPAGDDLLRLFWESKVPGSYAPEIPYLEMVQAAYTKGYDTTQAERILPRALDLAKRQKATKLTSCVPSPLNCWKPSTMRALIHSTPATGLNTLPPGWRLNQPWAKCRRVRSPLIKVI